MGPNYPSPSLPENEQSRSVLIVDDDETTIDAFARMLRLEGYEVRTARSAEAAFVEMETSHPDAILLDLRMPVTDGISFLRRLRAYEKHGRTPVAVITGDYSIEDTRSGELRELEADVYFKPVWLEDLLGITQRLLQRKV